MVGRDLDGLYGLFLCAPQLGLVEKPHLQLLFFCELLAAPSKDLMPQQFQLVGKDFDFSLKLLYLAEMLLFLTRYETFQLDYVIR